MPMATVCKSSEETCLPISFLSPEKGIVSYSFHGSLRSYQTSTLLAADQSLRLSVDFLVADSSRSREGVYHNFKLPTWSSLTSQETLKRRNVKSIARYLMLYKCLVLWSLVKLCQDFAWKTGSPSNASNEDFQAKLGKEDWSRCDSNGF